MDLVIDIGNNFTKSALFHETEIVERTLDEKHDVEELKKLSSNHNIERVIVSSVRPISPEMEEYLNQFPYLIILSHEIPLPIELDYHTPETLGRDRLAGVAAANALFPEQASLVIDAGTCITYDFIEANGVYRGGSISPGLNMRYEALNKLTGALPYVKHEDPKILVGKSTENSIKTGVFNGFMHEINGTIRRYKLEKSPLNIVICGGNAEDILPGLEERVYHEQDLVLIGLHKILIHNALQKN